MTPQRSFDELTRPMVLSKSGLPLVSPCFYRQNNPPLAVCSAPSETCESSFSVLILLSADYAEAFLQEPDRVEIVTMKKTKLESEIECHEKIRARCAANCKEYTRKHLREIVN